MALDPRLMMIDYSPIQQAAQTFTTGMQNRRMKQVEGLAGQALMGDPSAMQNLSQLDPMMAAKVQDQMAQQQAAQTQAGYQKKKMEREEIDWFTTQQERYGKMLSNTRNFDEAKRMHDRLMATDRGYQMLNQAAAEQGIDTEFTKDDLGEIKLQFGAVGFGNWDVKDVVDLYNNREPVKDLEATMAAMKGIQDNYARFKKEGGVASAAAIGKQAIQMVEKGVVRGDEAAAFGGLGLPVDKNGNLTIEKDAVDEFVKRWAEGALQGNQVDSLAQMSIDVFNAKVDTVADLQARMEEAGLGTHDPNAVFIATGRPKKMEQFVKLGSWNWNDEQRAAYQHTLDNPDDPDNPAILKKLGL